MWSSTTRHLGRNSVWWVSQPSGQRLVAPVFLTRELSTIHITIVGLLPQLQMHKRQIHHYSLEFQTLQIHRELTPCSGSLSGVLLDLPVVMRQVVGPTSQCLVLIRIG